VQCLSLCRSKCESKEETRREAVFDDNVFRISIPSHSRLLERIRSRNMSIGTHEIADMASRNMLICFEGWDWRNVAGREDMLHIDGELVNPIHSNYLLWQP
jgi:hypothetical protein